MQIKAPLEGIDSKDFASLSTLQELDLRGIQMTTLPEDLLSHFSDLRVFGLHESAVTFLPEGLLLGLPNLKFVSFYDTLISTLPEHLFTRAQWGIRLTHNQIPRLPDDEFDAIRNNRAARITLDRDLYHAQGEALQKRYPKLFIDSYWILTLTRQNLPVDALTSLRIFGSFQVK